MEEAGEECGVFGIYLKDLSQPKEAVPSLIAQGLSMLQHRGQKSAGMSVYNPRATGETRRKILTTYKGVGLVSEVFKLSHRPEHQEILQRCSGIAGIGHTRYSTAGAKDDYFASQDEAQPFERRHPRAFKRFAICFNGNLANSAELGSEMENKGYILETAVDTEVLMNLLSWHIKLESDGDNVREPLKPNLFNVVQESMLRLDGSYNTLSLFADGDLLAFRDPHGFHPLCWGENDYFYALASESIALEKVGINRFRDVNPGEALIFNSSGVRSKQLTSSQRSFCHFEFVYFSKSPSIMEGRSVKEVRRALGIQLANEEPLKNKFDSSYLVVPAPMTSIPAAEAYANALGLELRCAIEKNSSARGFINPSFQRMQIMNGTYLFHPDLKDRKIIILDDSLVRGETSKILVKGAKDRGAREIHLRFTEPAISHPCFYGIDYPTHGELMASRMSSGCSSQEELEFRIAKELGADAVRFQTLDSLVTATGMPKSDLCLACLTGQYPTSCGQKCAGLAK